MWDRERDVKVDGWLLFSSSNLPCSLFLQDMSESGGQQVLVRARFNFQQTNEDELSFSKGDIISVSRQEDGGWWEGSVSGRTGWFPSNYVREAKGSGGCGHFLFFFQTFTEFSL